MSWLEIQTIMPQIILSAFIVAQLLLIAINRSRKAIFYLTLLAIASCLTSYSMILDTINTQATILFYFDGFSLGINAILLFCGLIITLLSYRYLKSALEVHDEFYVLLLLVLLGATLLAISNHFASVFLSIELLSLSLVAMVGYLRRRQQSLEASFKYLILSATASSILLLGMAFIYAYSGEMSFYFISQKTAVADPQVGHIWMFSLGCCLLLAGIAFKLSLVPFHYWTPDVYHGAPAPVAMTLATVSKISVFAVLLKFWFFSNQYIIDTGAEQHIESLMINIIAVIAIASMLVGNLLALFQSNIKRLMAYSSIAHMGYLLIVLYVQNQSSMQLAWESALFYLFVYALATLVVFSFISQTSNAQHPSDNDNWHNWQGLFWRNRLQASTLIAAFLSLAGVPLTAGFIGKFYLVATAVDNHAWALLIALVVGSSISLFYYLKVIFIMFSKRPSQHELPLSGISHAVLIFLAINIIVFGVLPDLISEHVRLVALSHFG
ncbi:NADH-quinone oxidoreductase subunit N [Thalassotalea sp. HSM 43]|uniref:NADH-quinone oxidoreductase subunit N n=1 Tax=Thalassotalea sp. HSM 43 TaxID=2552945 RepID=UPI0010811242|nr:NADH-quinone oxidoreductase subunit N [Thalassotalea sp. HSM 43]QBY05514.1 NADH-quinone oxidoreductase subunit N [Thalassotalea sp. HSM 43]